MQKAAIRKCKPHQLSSPSSLIRHLSSSPPPPPTHASNPLRKKTFGVNESGSIPDFIEKWNPTIFKQVGCSLVGATLLSHPLTDSIALTAMLGTSTISYWYIGLSDIASVHSLRRNFPLLCHIRYVLESVRPEIQQYFIQADADAAPYSRNARSTIYQRSKRLNDSIPLGTQRDVYKEGYEWASHSMFPVHYADVNDRVVIGNEQCSQPYSASIFNISAMSYGSLSSSAITALNKGALLTGCYHNTGEGGISKFHLQGGDMVWNIGSAYFGCGDFGENGARRFNEKLFVENALNPNVKMIEIKISQGAKPSHGGVLPALKITKELADARGLGPGPWLIDCVSPPSHSAFSSPIGLLKFVHRLRALSGGKPIGFKICIGDPREFCAIVQAMLKTGIIPDFITIDGGEGGTGSAPREFCDSIGMPLGEGLRLVKAILKGSNLRSSIKLIGAGKVYNGFSLIRTLSNGADIVNAARSFMFSLGCIQSLKCHTNNCPTGITTHRKDLESGLDVTSKSYRVYNFHTATVTSTREIIGAMGLSHTSDVTEKHLFRRVSGIKVESYEGLHSTYFPLLKGGELLDEQLNGVPEHVRVWWVEGNEIMVKRGED